MKLEVVNRNENNHNNNEKKIPDLPGFFYFNTAIAES